jgi:hypothetical protein
VFAVRCPVKRASLLTLLFIGFSSAASHGQAVKNVVVSGHVVDINGASIKSASLEFAKEGENFEKAVSSKGRFSVDLPSGKYVVTVSALGFCSRTLKILLQLGINSIYLDPILLDCSDCNLVNLNFDAAVKPDGEPRGPVGLDVSQYRYKKEELLEVFTPELPPAQIFFGRRELMGDLTVYRSLACLGWPQSKPVIFTSGPIAMSASTLTLSRKDQAIRAKGNVIMLDEQGLRRGSSVELVVVNNQIRVSSIR